MPEKNGWIGVTQPSWMRHQAEGSGGYRWSASQPHEFAIRHQFPIPALD